MEVALVLLLGMVGVVALAAAVGGRLQPTAAIGPDYREAVVVGHRPVSLDPLIDAQDPGVRTVGQLLYRHLLRLDNQALPAADLAGGYTITPDGLTYTVPMQPNQLWSDGSAVSTDDVLATVRFVQSPWFADAAAATGWRRVIATARGGALVFTLPSPQASFPVTLSELPVLPLGQATSPALVDLAARATSPMPTSGPYTVSGTTLTTLELVANPQATPQPRLRRLEIRLVGSFAEAANAFASGAVDAVLATTPAERSQLLLRRGSTAHDLVTFRFVDLLFNERVPGLDDPAVRRAVSTALDRDRLIAGPLDGFAAGQTGPIAAGIRWIGPTGSAGAVDPHRASMMLDAAGWKPGPSGTRSRAGVSLGFSLAVADADPLPAVARDVAAQLQAIGMAITVVVMPTGGFAGGVITPHSFQLALADWNTSADPDVSSFWRSSAAPPHGLNVTGAPDDPFLDQDLDALATVSDVSLRRAAAVRVTADLAADAPAVFLYAPEHSLVVSAPFAGLTTPPVGDPHADVAFWQR